MTKGGRNIKTNFDFFRLDSNFFSNKKIKALRRHFGSVGILTYLYILSCSYGNDGYYIKIASVEDFAYDIAESISNSNLTKVADVATDCIHYLASRGEINKHLLDKGVISGESIQRQYIEMCLASKRKVEIVEEYRLVDTSEYPMRKNAISSEEMAVNSEEITINSEEMQRNKSKIKDKSIYQSITPYNPPVGEIAEIPINEQAILFRKFVDEFDVVVVPNTDLQVFTSENLKVLTDKFRRISMFGGQKHDSKWIADRCVRICSGCYDYAIDREYTVKSVVDESTGEAKEEVTYRVLEKETANKQSSKEESSGDFDEIIDRLIKNGKVRNIV